MVHLMRTDNTVSGGTFNILRSELQMTRKHKRKNYRPNKRSNELTRVLQMKELKE